MILEVAKINLEKFDAVKSMILDVEFKNKETMKFTKFKKIDDQKEKIFFDFTSKSLEIFDFNLESYSIMNTDNLINTEEKFVINFTSSDKSSLHFSMNINKAYDFLEKLKEFMNEIS